MRLLVYLFFSCLLVGQRTGAFIHHQHLSQKSYSRPLLQSKPISSSSTYRGRTLQALEASDVLQFVTPVNVLLLSGGLHFAQRSWAYVDAQYWIATLLGRYCQNGTAFEMAVQNGQRNIYYYPPTLEQLVVASGDKDKVLLTRSTYGKIQAAAKSKTSVVVLPEAFEDVKTKAGTIDTIVSTFTLCKKKDPARTIEQALRLLKPGGRLVFVEPDAGEGLLKSIRSSLGEIHRSTGWFSDPSLSVLDLLAKNEAQLESVNYQIFTYGGLDPLLCGVAVKVGVPEEEEDSRAAKREAPQGFDKKGKKDKSKK